MKTHGTACICGMNTDGSKDLPWDDACHVHGGTTTAGERMTTQSQIRADLPPDQAAVYDLAIGLGEFIQALGQVRLSHLYAELGGCLTFRSLDTLIDALVTVGVVRRDGLMLTWIGPPPKES